MKKDEEKKKGNERTKEKEAKESTFGDTRQLSTGFWRQWRKQGMEDTVLKKQFKPLPLPCL